MHPGGSWSKRLFTLATKGESVRPPPDLNVRVPGGVERVASRLLDEFVDVALGERGEERVTLPVQDESRLHLWESLRGLPRSVPSRLTGVKPPVAGTNSVKSSRKFVTQVTLKVPTEKSGD